MVEIEVYSKKKDKLRQPAADWLPSTPFLMSVSGPSMSGKGVYVQNIIMNTNLYHDEKATPFSMKYIIGRAVLSLMLI